jgi:hypothetical protein
MFDLLKRHKKEKREDENQILIGSEIVKNQSVKKMTAQAEKTYTKPEYNPETRKKYYDDAIAHKAVKDAAFSDENVVKDPYTNAELVQTKKEAKLKYGSDWQEHLGEADHIDPLNKLVNRAKDKLGFRAWVKTEDIKEIANSQDNMQIISRRTNQTGGKGGSSQTEWSRDYEKMQKISDMSGESEETVANKIRETGETAEKINNYKLAKAGLKNAASTAHTAGKYTAANAGGTAATISSITNICSYINGDETMEEALENIGRDSAKACASGYVNGAGLTVINNTLASTNSDFIVALGEKNVAGKTITAVAVTGDTIVKWGSGKITTEECLVELGDKGSSLVGSRIGTAIGEWAIPIPVVGGAIGGFIGGALTDGVYKYVINELRCSDEEQQRKQQEIYEKMMKYYAEQNRRKEVQQLIRTNTENAVINSVQSIILSKEFQNLMYESMTFFVDYANAEKRIAECILVTLQLQEYHRQLQEAIGKYFVGYEYCFASALDLMEDSLKIGDYDGAIYGINQITKLYGKTPLVESTEDFKKKMFGNGGITL